MKNLGDLPKDLEFDTFEMPEDESKDAHAAPAKEQEPASEPDVEMAPEKPTKQVLPPQEDEYQWKWKVRLIHLYCSILPKRYVQPELETTRRTFFL